MERIKRIGLRGSFFLLALCGLAVSLVLLALLWQGCGAIAARYSNGGYIIGPGGLVERLPSPSPEEARLLELLAGRKAELEVVMTGRDPSRALLDAAEGSGAALTGFRWEENALMADCVSDREDASREMMEILGRDNLFSDAELSSLIGEKQGIFTICCKLFNHD